MRLIDADELRDIFLSETCLFTPNEVLDYIDSTCTVDAVEVVQCRDCTNRMTGDCPMDHGSEVKMQMAIKRDNCKDCSSNCEHAGKDREFVCVGGTSCKKANPADLVHVVRCQDCRKFKTYKCPMYNANLHTDFCSRGERRNNE